MFREMMENYWIPADSICVVDVRENALNALLAHSLSSFVFQDAYTLYLNSYRTRGEGVESSSLIGYTHLLFHEHSIRGSSKK